MTFFLKVDFRANINLLNSITLCVPLYGLPPKSFRLILEQIRMLILVNMINS